MPTSDHCNRPPEVDFYISFPRRYIYWLRVGIILGEGETKRMNENYLISYLCKFNNSENQDKNIVIEAHAICNSKKQPEKAGATSIVADMYKPR